MQSTNSSKNILLTGITGNLGAYAALEFLARGYRVYAVARSRTSLSLCQKRVVRNLREIADPGYGLDEKLDQLEVLLGDIADAASIDALHIPDGIDETWHFASSLKYMPKDREEIFGANLDGLKNVMRLHRRCARPGARFFYIGTAYLGGKDLLTIPEARIDYDENMSFNNDYEVSKLLAENIFLDAVEKGELAGAVFRPSIVIGDKRTTKLVNYNGYYLVVKAWHGLCQSMKELHERNMVVRIGVDPDHSGNLIPINDVVETMLQISETGYGDKRIFNLVNREEVPMRGVFDILEKAVDYELKAVLCDAEEFRAAQKTRYEKLVSYGFTYTSPYMKNRIVFEAGNVERVLGRELRVPIYPEILDRLTSAYVATLLRGGSDDD